MRAQKVSVNGIGIKIIKHRQIVQTDFMTNINIVMDFLRRKLIQQYYKIEIGNGQASVRKSSDWSLLISLNSFVF